MLHCAIFIIVQSLPALDVGTIRTVLHLHIFLDPSAAAEPPITLSLLLIACTNFSDFSVKTKNR